MHRAQRKRFLALAAAAVASAGFSLSAHAQTTVGTFSGGDPGEGLDFQGDFPYAVNANSGDAPVTIQDATFIPDPGLIVSDNVTPFGAPNYGGSADDASLSAITDFVKWGNTTDVTINLPALTTGGQYKLQLLFNEACCDRGFDVLIEDVNVVDNFNPGNVQGSRAGGGPVGAVITHEFTAADDTLNIVLDSVAGQFPDNNPIIDAFTLELVPEPGSLTLLGVGAAGLLFRRRRR